MAEKPAENSTTAQVGNLDIEFYIIYIMRTSHIATKLSQPRARGVCLGELIQIDDYEHHWFEDRAPMCTALV
jgi:hypothetical protein